MTTTPEPTRDEQVPESDTASDTRAQLLLQLLFQTLRVNDTFLNEAAAEPLVQFGTRPVPRLIQVAVNRKDRRPYRLRALTVLGRIGKLSSPENYMVLHRLLLEDDPEFRAVMYRVLPALGVLVGPQGVPAEIAARCLIP